MTSPSASLLPVSCNSLAEILCLYSRSFSRSCNYLILCIIADSPPYTFAEDFNVQAYETESLFPIFSPTISITQFREQRIRHLGGDSVENYARYRAIQTSVTATLNLRAKTTTDSYSCRSNTLLYVEIFSLFL